MFMISTVRSLSSRACMWLIVLFCFVLPHNMFVWFNVQPNQVNPYNFVKKDRKKEKRGQKQLLGDL